MIEQAHYWQAHLEGTAAWFEFWFEVGGFDDACYPEVELKIFGGCFASRKLMESELGPGALKDRKLTICKYPHRTESIDTTDSTHFSINYDILGGRTQDCDFRSVVNLFVHSHIFSPFVFSGKILGLFVASDRTRNTDLTYVTVGEMCRLFREIASSPLKNHALCSSPGRKLV